jgi:hypothetical protein
VGGADGNGILVTIGVPQIFFFQNYSLSLVESTISPLTTREPGAKPRTASLNSWFGLKAKKGTQATDLYTNERKFSSNRVWQNLC